jgi:hypothetical protein
VHDEGWSDTALSKSQRLDYRYILLIFEKLNITLKFRESNELTDHTRRTEISRIKRTNGTHIHYTQISRIERTKRPHIRYTEISRIKRANIPHVRYTEISKINRTKRPQRIITDFVDSSVYYGIIMGLNNKNKHF